MRKKGKKVQDERESVTDLKSTVKHLSNEKQRRSELRMMRIRWEEVVVVLFGRPKGGSGRRNWKEGRGRREWERVRWRSTARRKVVCGIKTIREGDERRRKVLPEFLRLFLLLLQKVDSSLSLTNSLPMSSVVRWDEGEHRKVEKVLQSRYTEYTPRFLLPSSNVKASGGRKKKTMG